MKKWLLIISATVICVAAAFLYFFSLTPTGDTITSRESILTVSYTHLDVYKRQQNRKALSLCPHSPPRRCSAPVFPGTDIPDSSPCLLYTSAPVSR